MLTILSVTQALCFLHDTSSKTGKPLTYGSLQATNIFVAQNGTVKLGSCGSEVWPRESTRDSLDQQRGQFRQLIRHLVSRNPEESKDEYGIHKQRMISLPSIGRQIDMKFEPSPLLMDFLELCSVPEVSDERLLNVRNESSFFQQPAD